jgi:hypothetical protein
MGVASRVTLLTAATVEIQPAVLVPVKLYEVFATGITVEAPLLNVYDKAPEGVMVKTPPLQTVPLFTAITGVSWRVTVLCALKLTQPAVEEPMTEYVVLPVGITVLAPLL